MHLRDRANYKLPQSILRTMKKPKHEKKMKEELWQERVIVINKTDMLGGGSLDIGFNLEILHQ